MFSMAAHAVAWYEYLAFFPQYTVIKTDYLRIWVTSYTKASLKQDT